MSNYPTLTQSEEKRAPWNESLLPNKEFNVFISQTLNKDTTINTDNYFLETTSNGEAKEYLGIKASGICYQQQHYTPLELINILKEFCEDLLNKGDIQKDFNFEELIKECGGWEAEELYIDEC